MKTSAHRGIITSSLITRLCLLLFGFTGTVADDVYEPWWNFHSHFQHFLSLSLPFRLSIYLSISLSNIPFPFFSLSPFFHSLLFPSSSSRHVYTNRHIDTVLLGICQRESFKMSLENAAPSSTQLWNKIRLIFGEPNSQRPHWKSSPLIPSSVCECVTWSAHLGRGIGGLPCIKPSPQHCRYQ